MKCEHRSVAFDHLARDVGDGIDMEYRCCVRCGAWLSLGESNDEPEAVRVEMRAAKLSNVEHNEHEFTDSEWLGWEQDERYVMCGEIRNVHEDMSEEQYARWHAGYLARCIAEHEETQS